MEYKVYVNVPVCLICSVVAETAMCINILVIRKLVESIICASSQW